MSGQSGDPGVDWLTGRPACYDAEMDLRVEFYGIARQRAGVPHVALELPGPESTLAEALRQLADRLPDFGRECLESGRLRTTLAANLGGERFVSDPALVIRDGQSLLILSADAGG